MFIALLAIHTAFAQIQVLAVTDAATFTPGLPFACSLATVFCTGLTGINRSQAATSYPLPYQIDGVSVTINGMSAPLLAVGNPGGYQQINFVRGVSVNGTNATISYLGLAPGSAGVFQINFQVSGNTPNGDAIITGSSRGGVCLSTSACGSNLLQCTYSRPAKLPVRAGQQLIPCSE